MFIKTMSWLEIKNQEAIAAAGGYKDDPEVSTRRNMELRRVFEQEHGLFAENPTKSMVKKNSGSICYSCRAV